MNLAALLRVAMRALAVNKLRSLLTMLGMGLLISTRVQTRDAAAWAMKQTLLDDKGFAAVFATTATPSPDTIKAATALPSKKRERITISPETDGAL